MIYTYCNKCTTIVQFQERLNRCVICGNMCTKYIPIANWFDLADIHSLWKVIVVPDYYFKPYSDNLMYVRYITIELLKPSDILLIKQTIGVGI